MNECQGYKTMLIGLRNRSLILIASLFLAIGAGVIYSSDWEYKFYTSRVERIIEKKSRLLRENVAHLREDGFDVAKFRDKSHRVNVDYLRKQGITLLAYADSSLFFWTDNSFDVPAYPFVDGSDSRLAFIHNGYFLTESFASDDTIIIGLLRVYNSYDIENSLLRNGLPEYLRSPLNASIVTLPAISEYKISDSEGVVDRKSVV